MSKNPEQHEIPVANIPKSAILYTEVEVKEDFGMKFTKPLDEGLNPATNSVAAFAYTVRIDHVWSDEPADEFRKKSATVWVQHAPTRQFNNLEDLALVCDSIEDAVEKHKMLQAAHNAWHQAAKDL